MRSLIGAAVESGAETFSLIPRVDGKATEDGVRQTALRQAIREILPMLAGTDLVALIEPIGFASSSLKDKAELVDAIEVEGGKPRFRLVHDTFQHAIAGGGTIYPEYTAVVHISGISDRKPMLGEELDAYRVLVDEGDRCATVAQIAAFLGAGYEGAFSFECTSPSLQTSGKLEDDIRRSFELIEASLA